MDTPTKIRVLERMRELLSDPERVVLNPLHYFEREHDGSIVEMSITAARKHRETCRVCFCGAATLACWEIADMSTFDTGDGDDPDEDVIRPLIRDKIDALGIPLDVEVGRRYGGHNSVSVLTSALKQGYAVEVIDAVLADVRAGA